MNRGQLPRHGCNTIASLNLEFRRESGWGGFSEERLGPNPRSKWESQVARDFDSLAIDVFLIKLFHAVLAQRQTKRKTFPPHRRHATAGNFPAWRTIFMQPPSFGNAVVINRAIECRRGIDHGMSILRRMQATTARLFEQSTSNLLPDFRNFPGGRMADDPRVRMADATERAGEFLSAALRGMKDPEAARAWLKAKCLGVC